MRSPQIDFRSIRPMAGSQHTGFEELCCQLASLEYVKEQGTFFRKGFGGDAGVECFFRRRNGSEIGWQAKYFFSFGDSQVSQLTDSLKSALKKHPKLATYIVCLPFDFSDARKKGQKTDLQRWQAWVKKSTRAAARAGRKITIGLWGAHAIRGHLAKNEPAYAGRALYWFSATSLTSAWFRDRLDICKAALGERYTPELSVDVSIRRSLLALARAPWIANELDKWNLKVQELVHDEIRSLRPLERYGFEAKICNDLNGGIVDTAKTFDTPYRDPQVPIPIDGLRACVATLRDLNARALEGLRAVKEPVEPKKTVKPKLGTPTRTVRDDINYARHEIYKVHGFLEELDSALASDPWRLVNSHAVLVSGQAGSGKSHLLADIADTQIEIDQPAVLILGQTLVEGEPWHQIKHSLDLTDLSADTLLGALDAAGQAAGVKALVLVDALNERHGPTIWPSRLAAFLRSAKRFPHVAVVLSCRTTYLTRIVPSGVLEQIPHIEHQGFGGKEGDGARHYLMKRKIVRPGMPNFMPEFNNPLFLKTICDALQASGKSEIPRGMHGVTDVFKFYVDSVAASVEKRMGLDPHRRVVSLAIDRLAGAMIAAGRGWLEKTDAIRQLDAVHAPNNKAEDSLLFQLESEGVLTVEATSDALPPSNELVRFTFERMSDHFIARHLLTRHLKPADPAASFAAGTALHSATARTDEYGFAGILEAMAIQIPELVDREILDLVPLESRNRWALLPAFEASLIWRNQSKFSDRTMDLFEELIGGEESRIPRLLISIATEPANKFNARHLHERLIAMRLPQRDALWSTFLAEDGEDENSPLWTLIAWALEQGGETIEQERRFLAAIALTWMLSTTHRLVRDRATKALARLLALDLGIARDLLKLFDAVDDPYVLERMYAAVYGAALQREDVKGLPALAQYTFDAVFKTGRPRPMALLRDSARGILEYAADAKVLPKSVDLKLARPPYKPSGALARVLESEIESYKQDYGNGNVFGDQIVSSSVQDGDFARYVVDGIASSWSLTPISEPRAKTSRDHYTEWHAAFQAKATTNQRGAFDVVFERAKAYADTQIRISGADMSRALKRIKGKKSPPLLEVRVRYFDANGPYEKARREAKNALDEAQKRFIATLDADAAEDYRIRAQGFLAYGLFEVDRPDSVEEFDQTWARRWICKRAHDLGWTPELFAQWERRGRISQDRMSHRIERIGKKYQWIALDELVAHLSDQYRFKGRYSSAESDSPYEGPWQISHRPMDPSLHILKTHDDGWRQWERTWWVPISPSLRAASVEARLGWLHSEADVINDSALIAVSQPKTGRRWLVVDGFASWKQRGLTKGRESMERETWFRLDCVIAKKSDVKTLLRNLLKRKLTSTHDLPSAGMPDEMYLGEYPWHPSCRNMPTWSAPGLNISVPLLQCVVPYSASRGGHDYSVDEAVNTDAPAPWLMKALNLRLESGLKLRYVNPSGAVQFFDPAVFEPGPHAALVDEAAFLKALDDQRLEPIWVVAGEKSVLGDLWANHGFGGRYVHTAVYLRSPSGKFTRHFYKEMELPYQEQLAALFDNRLPEEFRKFARGHIKPKVTKPGKRRSRASRGLRARRR